jgi:hypothetical protein
VFTKSIIALAVIIGATSGALAATRNHQHNLHAARAYGAYNSGVLAATRNHRHSPNPAWDVYDNGQYVGSDPDINVRMQLQFDHGSTE